MMAKSGKLFFFGLGERSTPGSLRVTKYPFTDDIQEIFAHSKPISKIRVSNDDNYCFSAGKDGALVIYSINDKDGTLYVATFP